MNLSGKSIRYWMQYEKISVENILVITDDIHLDFGTIRIKPKGSSGGHHAWIKRYRTQIKFNCLS